MVVESIGNDPILAIHYEGWNNWYDEFLPIDSDRIARLGFYTTRDDIPKYKMNRVSYGMNGAMMARGIMQSLIVNRANPSSWGTKKNTIAYGLPKSS